MRLVAPCFALLLVLLPAGAGEEDGTFLTERELSLVDDALALLNMTRADAGFDKLVLEDDWRLPLVDRTLKRPLEAADVAWGWAARARGTPEAILGAATRELGWRMPAVLTPEPVALAWEELAKVTAKLSESEKEDLVRAAYALLVSEDAHDGVVPKPEREAEPEALSVGSLIAKSGLVGWIIIGLSIVMLAMVIENFVTLNREKLAPPELIDEIQSLFDEGQFQEAMELCENERNFFTRVCAAGIAKIGHDFEVIETSIQEMGDEEAIKLHQKVGWIAVLAAVSPMLGLFGTVQGMIASFHTIATKTNPSPSELADGIYTALLTTLFGLMVAIPATAAFSFIRNRLVRSTIEIGAIVEDLFERFRKEGAQ